MNFRARSKEADRFHDFAKIKKMGEKGRRSLRVIKGMQGRGRAANTEMGKGRRGWDEG